MVKESDLPCKFGNSFVHLLDYATITAFAFGPVNV